VTVSLVPCHRARQGLAALPWPPLLFLAMSASAPSPAAHRKQLVSRLPQELRRRLPEAFDERAAPAQADAGADLPDVPSNHQAPGRAPV